MRLLAPLSLAALALAQTPADPVIRVNVNLVQIDATVTDKTGRHIADLKADDFELYQDGKEQAITRFSFVASTAAALAASNSGTSPRPSPKNIRREQIRRTIAIVIDDLTISWESMAFIRPSLRKFIDESVQQGDLVAIIRTSAGSGAFQQFTTDKAQLLASAERVRFRASPTNNAFAFAPIQGNDLRNNASADQEILAAQEDQRLRELQSFQQSIFAAGTLGALDWVVRGLRELPGRKSVVVFSENLKIYDRPTNPSPDQISRNSQSGVRWRTVEAIQALTDLANRSGVVIYSIDPRGLPTMSLQAGDDVRDAVDARTSLTARQNEYTDSQQGLGMLALETGGLFFRNDNDLANLLRKAADDQEGYYLIGYNPDDDTFAKASRKLRRLELKVKRAGVTVRYRRGFFGLNDDERLGPGKQPLVAAMMSPFGASEIGVRLTPVFSADKNGSFVQTMMHVDAKDLTYEDEPAKVDDPDQRPWKRAVVQLMVVTFGENGEPVGQTAKDYSVRLRGQTYEATLKYGFVQTLIHPVAKPGAYQLRAAVLDRTSKKTGAASQFIDVPDLKKRRLALSGLIVSSTGWPDRTDTLGAPPIRIFRPGETLQYAAYAFNAQGSGNATLETQVFLLRDGKPIYSGTRLTATPGMDAAIPLGGEVSLGTNLEPGEYELQFTVTDRGATQRNILASSIIEFEVRRQ